MQLRSIHIRKLAKSNDGAAAVELAFLAPVFVLLLLAVFDTGFSVYANAVLRGEVESTLR